MAFFACIERKREKERCQCQAGRGASARHIVCTRGCGRAAAGVKKKREWARPALAVREVCVHNITMCAYCVMWCGVCVLYRCR